MNYPPCVRLLLLSVLFLSGCAPQVRTSSYEDAARMVSTPSTMYRGTDYLGSDADFHYFEYKKELGKDTRFRIPRADMSLFEALHEIYPYKACFPARRDAHDCFIPHF